MTWRVVEIFGPTLQGEGKLAGARTHFVRFGGCDYRCVWCDSMYAVSPEFRAQWTPMHAAEIVARCVALAPATDCPWITLSGGNPALYDLAELVRAFHAAGYRVAVETQGTVAAEWLDTLDHVCLSPKPPSSGMVTDFTKLAACLSAAGDADTILKVVVFDAADVAYAADVAALYPHVPFYLSVGTDRADDPTTAILTRAAALVPIILAAPELRHARLLPQLHVLLWGHARGV